MIVAVIGGGASGMMAAICAAKKPQTRVMLFERQARVGRKLSATGNGRCNLTNMTVSPDHYHGAGADFITPALSSYGVDETLSLFKRLGLLTVAQADGRVYPHSDAANSVVDVLRFALEAVAVELKCGCEIKKVSKSKGGFQLEWNDGSAYADKLIIACGGLAGEKLGGSDSGYKLLEALGHSRTSLQPALVQLKTEGKLTRSLKGIRADCAVKVFYPNASQPAAESAGELQFTDYGVSGPAIFDISRAALQKPDAVLSLDLLRLYSEEETVQMLSSRIETFPFLRAEEVFTGMLHNRLGRTLVKVCGYEHLSQMKDLQTDEIQALAHIAKNFTLTVSGSTGFSEAQVTSGGILTDGFDPATLESRLCRGLYAVGEVLDVDGDCGGFNLQWAWSSGRLAGASI